MGRFDSNYPDFGSGYSPYESTDEDPDRVPHTVRRLLSR